MDVSMDMHSNTCRFISIFISVDFMKNEPSYYELKLSFIYNLSKLVSTAPFHLNGFHQLPFIELTFKSNFLNQ